MTKNILVGPLDEVRLNELQLTRELVEQMMYGQKVQELWAWFLQALSTTIINNFLE